MHGHHQTDMLSWQLWLTISPTMAISVNKSLYHHYIPSDSFLEELLIDFHELVGEHSGENMADAVWDTLKTYGISDQVSLHNLRARECQPILCIKDPCIHDGQCL